MPIVDEGYKEVRFDEYCKKCKHYELRETEDPCFTCLEDPINLYSHKPVKYEEKEK